MGEESQRRRNIIRKFVSIEECKELEFIHKSSSTVGYRPNVFSTTLSHLIATNSFHFLVPFLPIRDRLKDTVEEFFGCEFELFVEFTGLISWTRGASIGWHSDDNRPYLKQRDFTAVCYLNNYGEDFKGGLFHFQDGEPSTLVPMAGDVAIYTADSNNIHSVDEIIEGERLTLTIWFSRNNTHDEDAKLVSFLSEKLLNGSIREPPSKLPIPASSNMYWFSSDSSSDQQSGFDICCARMHVLGFDFYCPEGKGAISDSTEVLLGPLQLSNGNQLLELKFVNVLHALQVVQFYAWKVSELSQIEVETAKLIQLSESQQQQINSLKSLLLKDNHLAEMIFSSKACEFNSSLDLAKLSAAFVAFEEYSCRLQNELLLSLPHWSTHQIIHKVSLSESSEAT